MQLFDRKDNSKNILEVLKTLIFFRSAVKLVLNPVNIFIINGLEIRFLRNILLDEPVCIFIAALFAGILLQFGLIPVRTTLAIPS